MVCGHKRQPVKEPHLLGTTLTSAILTQPWSSVLFWVCHDVLQLEVCRWPQDCPSLCKEATWGVHDGMIPYGRNHLHCGYLGGGTLLKRFLAHLLNCICWVAAIARTGAEIQVYLGLQTPEVDSEVDFWWPSVFTPFWYTQGISHLGVHAFLRLDLRPSWRLGIPAFLAAMALACDLDADHQKSL